MFSYIFYESKLIFILSIFFVKLFVWIFSIFIIRSYTTLHLSIIIIYFCFFFYFNFNNKIWPKYLLKKKKPHKWSRYWTLFIVMTRAQRLWQENGDFGVSNLNDVWLLRKRRKVKEKEEVKLNGIVITIIVKIVEFPISFLSSSSKFNGWPIIYFCFSYPFFIF